MSNKYKSNIMTTQTSKDTILFYIINLFSKFYTFIYQQTMKEVNCRKPPVISIRMGLQYKLGVKTTFPQNKSKQVSSMNSNNKTLHIKLLLYRSHEPIKIHNTNRSKCHN